MMRRLRRSALISTSIAFVCLFSCPCLGQSQAVFDKLKTLAGEWQAKVPDGRVVRVSYEVASGGITLVETLFPPSEPSMLSIYHVDGDKLAMTHYCTAGNQPRMKAVLKGSDLKSLNFEFVGATNLAKPSDGHMHSLTITFKDKDHIRHEWTWREAGKDTLSVFDFERKSGNDKAQN